MELETTTTTRKMKGSKSLIESRDEIRGEVTRIFYSANGWTAGVIESEGHDISFAGNVSVHLKQPVVMTGTWGNHPKYGKQFTVTSVELDKAMDKHGLANYLSHNPAFRGIGQARAWQIAEKFGDTFEETLIDNPEAIARATGTSVGVILDLQRAWLESQSINKLMAELSSYELTWHQANLLMKNLGNNAIGILQSNPYVLIREIRGFGFKRVDKIALRSGISKSNPNRVEAGVLDVISTELNDGHTWVEYQDVIDKANLLLILDDLGSREYIESALRTLIDTKQLVSISVDFGILVAFPWVYKAERELMEIVTKRAGDSNISTTMSKIWGVKLDSWKENIQRIEPRLNQEQVLAVHCAFAYNLSIITGAAGSGKTFTINTICNIADSNKLSITLAASTGKAAKRMEESTGRSAMTIHRLLGYQGESDLLALNVSTIDTDILVVDEFSMVDIPLATALFRAIDFSQTSLIIVGDHNQLPPVGPGSVLRDLIETQIIPTVHLQTVVRQAGVLKENSSAILRGEVRPSVPKPTDGSTGDWYVIKGLTEQYQVRDFIRSMFVNWMPNPLNFDILNDVQVLTPTHRGDCGTVELNKMLQEIIQRKVYGRDVDNSGLRKAKLLHGDKVICTQNNYLLDIMNGTMGILSEPDTDSIEVSSDTVFIMTLDDGSTRELQQDDLKNIELAYAMSIHKSQGSEFPCVISVIHKAHSFQHHRNLLYTAATRASRCAIILTDGWGLGNCAAKVNAGRRRTFLPVLINSVGAVSGVEL
jgi:exodeoxyribonuclease V alpha subunit